MPAFVLMNITSQHQQRCVPSSVGTGGGCGEGWEPCACPRGHLIRWYAVTQRHCICTRTGTRPPHPLYPTPCPYSTRDQQLLGVMSTGQKSHQSSLADRPTAMT